LFVGGLLTDQWGPKETLITGCLVAGFGLASLGLSRNYIAALSCIGVLGAATGLLYIATIRLMPEAFLAAEIRSGRHHWDYIPAATNLGFVFVALGGLLVPFLVLFLVRKFSFRSGLLLLALLAVIPAGMVGLTEASSELESLHTANLGQLFGEYQFWLALAAVVAFYGLEISALRWTPQYLEEIGLRPRTRVMLWILFWTILLGVRLACGSIHSLNGFEWLVVVLAAVAAVLMGNMAGWYRAGSGAVSFLILAGCLGPIFPTLVGLILVLFREQPAVALGLLCAAGTLGRLVVAPVVDRLLASGKLRVTIFVSMILGLVLLFPPLIWLVLPVK
jgi:MFS family permease